MKSSAEKRAQSVPFMQQQDRPRTDHKVAMECMERGWTWEGKKFECRKDWEAAVLGYHGAFTF